MEKVKTFGELKIGDPIWYTCNLHDWSRPEVYITSEITFGKTIVLFSFYRLGGDTSKCSINKTLLGHSSWNDWYTTKEGAYKGMIRKLNDRIEEVEKEIEPLLQHKTKCEESLGIVQESYEKFCRTTGRGQALENL